MSSSSSSSSSAARRQAAREWSLRLIRGEGDILGAALGHTDKGAVIVNIQQGGLLDAWNRANPAPSLHPGLIITEVNGVRGYWDILEELRCPGLLNIKISDGPPAHVDPTWFEDIAAMGRSVEKRGGALRSVEKREKREAGEEDSGGGESFLIRLQQEDPSAATQFATLPTVVAGDCGVDRCAICMHDVAPDETLLQLKCKHAFHETCVSRWLAQSQGKHQFCPLCCQKVLCSPEGVVITLGEECASAAGVPPHAGGGTRWERTWRSILAAICRRWHTGGTSTSTTTTTSTPSFEFPG